MIGLAELEGDVGVYVEGVDDVEVGALAGAGRTRLGVEDGVVELCEIVID